MRSFLCSFLILALSLPFSCVFAKTHTLKKGETLASVARKYYGEPVFGPNGTLKKLYKLNPWAEQSPNLVSTGKEIVVDGETPIEKTAKVAPQIPPTTPVVVPVPPTGTSAVTPPTPPPVLDVSAIVVEEKKAWDQKKIEDANAAAALAKVDEKKSEMTCPPATAEAPKCEDCAKMASQIKNAPPERLTFAQANEFFIVPYYSISKIALTNSGTGLSYNLGTSTSYGARLGWDHKFNTTFSMLLEANTQVWNSGATNTTTAATIADKINLYRGELALLNNIGEHSRFGIGFSYGNKIFIENFDATPANETAVTFTGLDPVVMAEFSLFDSPSFAMPLTLKWSPLAADVDKGVAGGLKAGNEITARLMFVHKLMDNQVTYGLTYLSNDQAEKDRTQKRTDTNVEFGMVF